MRSQFAISMTRNMTHHLGGIGRGALAPSPHGPGAPEPPADGGSIVDLLATEPAPPIAPLRSSTVCVLWLRTPPISWLWLAPRFQDASHPCPDPRSHLRPGDRRTPRLAAPP